MTGRHCHSMGSMIRMLAFVARMQLYLWIILSFRSVVALWPIPRRITTGSTPLTLADSFAIDLTSIENTPRDLEDAVIRTMDYLRNDKLERLVVGRGPGDDISLASARALKKLVLSIQSRHNDSFDLFMSNYNQHVWNTGSTVDNGGHVKSIAEITALPLEERDESYQLVIRADGSDATLTASTCLGLLRGLTTFGQIWYQYGDWIYTTEAPFHILDEPKYKWRGLLLDTARNFFSVNDLKRTISAMELSKMNMFHWHIVDSQSFPLVLPEFPELAEYGAYSPTKRYSTEDFDEVIAYAAARGVDVLLEIDVPGHTAVIHKSHPEYVACFEASPWAKYAAEPPAGQLRLTEHKVILFVQDLFRAAISRLPGKYFSTGGDEINKNCYAEDPVVQYTLKRTGQTLDQAIAKFTNRTHQTLFDNGKIPVVWQEMILDHGDLGLKKETIVLVWVASSHAKKVAKTGHRIVHAPSNYFYLDCGQGPWIGNIPDGHSWCDPFKHWQRAYSFDPLADLTPSEAKLVLGGQQLLWTEQSDPLNLDSILWPRAAASAEIFWTGPDHPLGGPLNGTEAMPRLQDLRYRLVQRGIAAHALQPEYCAVRPYTCN